MTEDNRMDEMIRSAASDYNRPPSVPRDEMWTAIQVARHSAGEGPRLHVTAGGAGARRPGGYTRRRTFQARSAWWGAAAAAVLLVATGIGIGRLTSSTDGPAASSDQAVASSVDLPVESAPSVVTTNSGGESAEPDTPMAEPSKSAASGIRLAESTRSDVRPGGSRVRRPPVVIGTGGLRLVSGNPAAEGGIARPAVSYQVATDRHLTDAEALLTSFTVESRDERMDAQFASWAKGLLSNTRLLLDSPAGEDPRRARLLEDLELVLAQIVQLSPGAAAQERELIQGSIRNGYVMTRLRTAIPAGQPRGFLER